MENQFFLNFQAYKSLVGETYFPEGRKYLLWSIAKNNFIILGSEPFTHLLVPDDNSLLANSIRNNSSPSHDYFSIPFSDLKFQPQLLKRYDDFANDAFLVKNTNQTKKIVEKEIRSPQTLTFKVRSQKKIREKERDLRIYKHHLEIEPLALGIEGVPEITKIVFGFGYGQSLESSPESLIKTNLHNHSILTESPGQTFTIQVKSFKVIGEENGEGNKNALLFSSWKDFEIDKFLQENPVKNGSDNKKSSPKQENKGLIIGLVILLTLLLVGAFLLIRKRKK